MDSLLQEITILPGVLGCFVFSSEQQIAGSKMPPIFKENSIRTIGNLLTRTIQIGNMAQMQFKGIEIKYNESLLIIKPLAQDALLVIICEPSANKSLISMTTGMLADDLATAMIASADQGGTRQQSRQNIAQATAPPPQAQQEPEKEAEISEELAPVLEKVKDALAMAIGPIAAPVMKDTIEIWAKKGETSLANLPALAKLLCDEINDDELEEEFLTEISQIKG